MPRQRGGAIRSPRVSVEGAYHLPAGHRLQSCKTPCTGAPLFALLKESRGLFAFAGRVHDRIDDVRRFGPAAVTSELADRIDSLELLVR